MIGYDKSEFQDPGGPRGDYLIIRAANGRREDYKVDGHIDDARANGVPVTLYTYCEPGGGNPEAQADRMCNVADRHGVKATLWADIEEGAGDLRWFEDRFVARCNQRGYQCGVYSGDYFWGAHNLGGAQGRWVAAYGPNDGRAHTAPGHGFQIWQFTSNPLDTNTADPTAISQLFAGAAPAPAPKPIIDSEASVLHVVQQNVDEKGIWIAEGVRISPEAAFDRVAHGAVVTHLNLAQFDRGLLGTVDPNNGIEDAPWFDGRLQDLRGITAAVTS